MGNTQTPEKRFDDSLRELKSIENSESPRDEFVKQYIGMIGTLAIRAIQRGSLESLDNLVNAGVIGLYKAAERYKRKRKKTKFGTYAFSSIRNCIRKEAFPKALESLDLSVQNKDDEPLALHDIIPDGGQRPDQTTFSADLWEAVSCLPKVSQAIINLRYKGGYQLEKIGEMMGISKQAVEQREKTALKKLKKFLAR